MRLFRKTPKLEAAFRPTRAVARELARQVDVAGELVLRNVGRDTGYWYASSYPDTRLWLVQEPPPSTAGWSRSGW